MIPALSLVWRYRKIAGIVILGLALALISWRIASWRTGYLKLGEAKEALRDAQQARENDRKTYLENSIKAEKEAQALAADLGEIRTRFAQMVPVLPKTLIVTREVPIAPEQKTCPDTRLSPDFRLRWNAAASP